LAECSNCHKNFEAKERIVFPVVVKSTPRALLSKIFFPAVLSAMFPVACWIIFSLTGGAVAGLYALAVSLVIVIVLLAFGSLFIVPQYFRLKNTTYTISESKIQVSSYGMFKFLGTCNNTVSLKQLRQIQAFSNSWLDILFFHCGEIILTVSGDQSDFRVENISNVGRVKNIIETIAFGQSSSGPTDKFEVR
jgi:uncharacterized membrane protein YdbT with pleckstrin-like domain